jgi:hypothetical protein
MILLENPNEISYFMSTETVLLEQKIKPASNLLAGFI